MVGFGRSLRPPRRGRHISGSEIRAWGWSGTFLSDQPKGVRNEQSRPLNDNIVRRTSVTIVPLTVELIAQDRAVYEFILHYPE